MSVQNKHTLLTTSRAVCVNYTVAVGNGWEIIRLIKSIQYTVQKLHN